jgi:hypothetical protein
MNLDMLRLKKLGSPNKNARKKCVKKKTKMKMGVQQAGMGVQTANRKHMRT